MHGYELFSGDNMTLIIRSGVTSSDAIVLHSNRTNPLRATPETPYQLTSSQGFYIRLVGPVLSTDILDFTFVSFNDPKNGNTQ